MSVMMKDTPDFNIQFVRLVEKYPVVYDISLDGYNKWEEQDKAWQNIANTVKGSVRDCKARWRNLRNAFLRYLRMSKLQHMKVKKRYYLADVMQFLIPFTKTRMQIGMISSPYQDVQEGDTEDDSEWNEPAPVSVTEEYSNISSEGASRDEFETKYEHAVDPLIDLAQKQYNVVTSREQQPADVGNSRKRQVTSQDPIHSNEIPVTDSSTNEDKSFFDSCLSDVASMTQSQKRKFRLGVLNLIEGILNPGHRSETYPNEPYCSLPYTVEPTQAQTLAGRGISQLSSRRSHDGSLSRQHMAMEHCPPRFEDIKSEETFHPDGSFHRS